MLGDLSKKYESNGNPAAISTGIGDLGGKSYGMYQMSRNVGALAAFIRWSMVKGYAFAYRLCNKYSQDGFDDEWEKCAVEYEHTFSYAQHQYIKEEYYDVAKELLKASMYDLDNHSDVMQDVVWSRAVQYGPYQIVEMFMEACKILGHPNLSYVDSRAFDYNMIEVIYLEVCKSEEWSNGSPALRESLYARFEAECTDALARL